MVASQQQQHFNIQQFLGISMQQNTQQRELQKDPDNEDQEGDLEGVIQRCSVKKVVLEISQNSQENTCARVSFAWSLQLH